MKSSRGMSTLILFYMFVAEILAIFIDADTRIKGVQIGGHELNKVNFADDTIIFLKSYYLPYQNTSDFKTIRSFKLKDKLFKKPSHMGWVM